MDILRTGKDLRRLNEIVNILITNGFGDLINRIGLGESLRKAGNLIRYKASSEFVSMPLPVRTRKALEEMGPTFVKLGQILATRVDIFPEDWIHEFEKLQDEVPAVPFEILEPQVEASLGEPISFAFKEIDPEPLGSASMAQVYKATTNNGKKVVLKIRRPGIQKTIEADLRLIRYIARLAASQSHELRRYRPVEMVKEIERSLLRELDFSIEGKNAERIATSLKRISYVKIPKVYWEWTCEDLNVQEYIKGIPAKNVAAIEAAGLDRKLIAHRGGKIVWKTMLEDGFFHADPHPGNFLALPRNRIAMLDFGMVGKLTASRREQLTRLVRHIVTHDAYGACAVLVEWADGPLNYDELVSDAEDFIDQYYGLSLQELNIPKMLLNVTEMLRTHEIALPPDIALFSKACITLEGFGRLINPDFDLMTEAEPLLKQLGKQRYSPVSLAKKLGTRALNLVDQIYDEPRPKTIPKSGTHKPPVDKQLVETLAKRMEHTRYRQTQMFVACSVLIASSVLCLLPQGPHFFGFSIYGLVGMGGSLGSIWIIMFLMWWSKRSSY